MANTIFPLAEDAIVKIAAGEVIERPSNAAKELLENSLDAGSTDINLEFAGGGKTLIRVADNGCGMGREDALLSVQRHTTSKIRCFDDLERLATFGFRGEALPSIASVSKLEIFTGTESAPAGTHLTLAGGKLLEEKECGRSRGCTVEVRDLFFNVPARLKFLKSDSGEKNRIWRTFEEIALANPDVRFEIRSDGRSRAAYPARDSLLRRIADLWGESFCEDTLFPLESDHPYLKIRGWVSQPQSHQPTKNNQFFYVNGRLIVSKVLTHALYDSFRDCLPHGRHPACVILLELDPAHIDVNVHPSKREVRFRHEPEIHGSLIREIRVRRARLSEAPGVLPALDRGPSSDPGPGFFTGEARRASAPAPADHPASAQTALLSDPPRVMSQFQSLYILAEQAGDLLIVDQHAAAERVLYEEFRKAVVSGEPPAAQKLLIPVVWNVTASQAAALRGTLEAFAKLGFRLEEFGPTAFRISEAPASLSENGLGAALDEAVAALEFERDPLGTPEEKIMSAACRAAVKANDRLSPRELEALLRELALCENPHTCPHGRPVRLVLTRQELDKRFGRT
ncbi:MAG: hypothetical protein A2902_02350 [Elusimicrobia bacterium RIFCSPLOWO2_01_FULL_64_13]|nr:MAG: hypothetical protein A2636_07220 [Elusimicrobia bacterium RIFCSPHIGHO2_01_FULL_64_10]OGR94386.1 MAG: hypothetical protein A2902_02350 [Elusimicrobia bacterium RIFCSPLOWO2_01_FULL_64_13]